MKDSHKDKETDSDYAKKKLQDKRRALNLRKKIKQQSIEKGK
jgi:hypothetical protein